MHTDTVNSTLIKILLFTSVPLVSSRYRPNVTSSQEFMLFSSEQNPVPILELVEQEMAYRASGKVKVFIEDDKDVSSLRHVLKVGSQR